MGLEHDNGLISAHPLLTESQKAALNRGKFVRTFDLILVPHAEIAKKCRMSPTEVKAVIDVLLRNNLDNIRPLSDVEDEKIFTTGDQFLDKVIGGGIRTSMLWEVVGESAAGKTQLALQLALSVQLPQSRRGISGSACYITTSSVLPTSRIVQILDNNPLCTRFNCSLDHIQTMAAPTISVLIQILSDVLPSFVSEISQKPGAKPVRLLVIDALAELFHSSNKTTTEVLVERSQNIVQISELLHRLANKWNIAVLVLNEVVDAFDQIPDKTPSDELLYHDQSRWFSRAHSLPGQDKKEASLGLVWANQVNTRIILSRTGRRRHFDQVIVNKRQRLDDGSHSSLESPETQLTLVRRLSVIFNSVARPVSLDYIVTKAGISCLPPEENPTPVATRVLSSETAPATVPQISPLDVGFAEDGDNVLLVPSSQPDEEEEYWA
ncbi:P-loop containing nucleoside triphosphate hydrolase protein [Mycena floridula]|nr:P-loop containing nucleoside triphosphate hydrolase protein [Mycena floridula]